MNNPSPGNTNEALRSILNRSRSWIVALGYLVLAYGILSILKVCVLILMTLNYMGAASMSYPLIISAGSGFLGIVFCALLIPMGIILIRAGGNLKSFLETDDYSAVVLYNGKIRTSIIIAVSVLIIDILSNIVTALLYYAVALMPTLTGFGD